MRHDILWLDIWSKILLQFGAEIISYKVKWASWGFNELKGSLTAPDKWKCHLRLNQYSRYKQNHTNTTKPSKLLFDLISLLFLATDAVGAGLNSRRIYAYLCAVVKEHAELKGRLPGPPIALLVFAAELVTPFGIFSHFEVDGIFLRECWKLVAKNRSGTNLIMC